MEERIRNEKKTKTIHLSETILLTNITRIKEENDASYTTKVCPSINKINKIKKIKIYTIIVSIIKTSTKLKVSTLSEAWAWELG